MMVVPSRSCCTVPISSSLLLLVEIVPVPQYRRSPIRGVVRVCASRFLRALLCESRRVSCPLAAARGVLQGIGMCGICWLLKIRFDMYDSFVGNILTPTLLQYRLTSSGSPSSY